MSRRFLLGASLVLALTIGTVVLARVNRERATQVHQLGEAVEVGYNERDRSGRPAVSTRFAITVLRVRKGSIADLTAAGFSLDADEREQIPYYVDARFENLGPNPVRRRLSVSLEDGDQKLIAAPILLSFGDRPFPQCNRVTEGLVRPGESYESCTLYLVDEDTKIGDVTFLSDRGPDREPEFVYWESS